MKLIACVDSELGLAFNSRRLSHDEEVIKRIKNLAPKLYINPYSKDLFPEAIEGLGEFFFAEVDLPDCVPDEIYLFNWNRLYPKDLTFTIDLNNYELLSTEDFRGSSHEKITSTHYRRK